MSNHLSDIQFLVLSLLMGGSQKGRALREAMKQEGKSKSLPAFYQLMSRMENAGLVKSWHETIVVGGQTLKEKYYELTGTGISEWESTLAFYQRVADLRNCRLGGA